MAWQHCRDLVGDADGRRRAPHRLKAAARDAGELRHLVPPGSRRVDDDATGDRRPPASTIQPPDRRSMRGGRRTGQNLRPVPASLARKALQQRVRVEVERVRLQEPGRRDAGLQNRADAPATVFAPPASRPTPLRRRARTPREACGNRAAVGVDDAAPRAATAALRKTPPAALRRRRGSAWSAGGSPAVP